MTPQEAKKEFIFSTSMILLRMGRSIEISKKEEALLNRKCQANGLAILALERQIPKKPKAYESLPRHRCPLCGCAIRVYTNDPYNKFCHYCGQAIDWSDEE